MADARRKLDIGLESGPVGSSRIHDSAPKHVAGEALYIDDIAAPEGLLHAYLGTSTIAHGRLLSLDLAAVRAAPGVAGAGTGLPSQPGRLDPTPARAPADGVGAPRGPPPTARHLSLAG